MPANKSFKLSSALIGHSQDVKSLSTNPAQRPILFSSSRDGTARSWYQVDAMDQGPGHGGSWVAGNTFENQHDGFVNAVQWFPAQGGGGEGYLATGGQDKLIHVWPLPTSLERSEAPLTPSNTLIGHEGNVCALATSPDGKRLVSGSWDKTAKVWDTSTFQIKYTLEGHEQAVWAVLALEGDEDLVLTGSADNLVRLWKGSKSTVTFRGHTQAVRALAKLAPGVGAGDLFASAGNDGTIRLWSLKSGESVHVLYGHDSFVYSLSPIPDSAGGGLISGGEDRTVRVWRAADGECEQTIVIPAVSVWTVACLSNGDIAAGSSDGLVRVFTRDDDRVADVEALAAFDEQVSHTALNSSQVGDVKKSELPGIEALASPGAKDGAIKMIKTEDDKVEAYSWTSATRTWQQIGEVVDAVGSNRKQLYNGQEYDYVFDVDIKEGAPPLKLPYNASQNPYDAASKFLIANDLPADYTDQVVQFIEKNTAGVTLGTAGNEYVDPYTGASRYTAGGAAPALGSGGFSGGDPYTGGGRTIPTPSAPKLLPHKTFLYFTQANLPALRTKLLQLNDELAQSPATSPLALSAEEIPLVDLLLAAAGASSTKTPDDKTAAVLVKLLQWPSSHVFPCIDLVRILSRHVVLPDTVPYLLEAIQNTAGSVKEQETNTMLAFRAFANLFGSTNGKALLKDEAVDIVDMIKRRSLVGVNKNGKVALATVALNYSVLAVQNDLDPVVGPALLEIVAQLVQDAESEVVYRSLIALGNLILSPEIKSSMPGAGIERLKTLAKSASARFSTEVRMKTVVVEIERVK